MQDNNNSLIIIVLCKTTLNWVCKHYYLIVISIKNMSKIQGGTIEHGHGYEDVKWTDWELYLIR